MKSPPLFAMPTYTYRCTSCQKEVELFQKITDEPAVMCPECGKPALERGIGGGQAMFQFKGKGFYETDYKKSSCCPCGKNSGDCKNPT